MFKAPPGLKFSPKAMYSAFNSFSICLILASTITVSPRGEIVAWLLKPASFNQPMTRSLDSSLGAIMESMTCCSRWLP
jgi:hypothetical protein